MPARPVSYTHLDVYKRQAYRALGETGAGIEDEALGPGLGLSLVVLGMVEEVAVEVVVAQAEGCLLYTSRDGACAGTDAETADSAARRFA